MEAPRIIKQLEGSLQRASISQLSEARKRHSGKKEDNDRTGAAKINTDPFIIQEEQKAQLQRKMKELVLRKEIDEEKKREEVAVAKV
jgi:hypothetical protein